MATVAKTATVQIPKSTPKNKAISTTNMLY